MKPETPGSEKGLSEKSLKQLAHSLVKQLDALPKAARRPRLSAAMREYKAYMRARRGKRV
jgi:hypothetical protein